MRVAALGSSWLSGFAVRDSTTNDSFLRASTNFVSRHLGLTAFVLGCLWVAVVSVHDAVLIVLNDDVIGDVERNPIGRWLIELQGGEVWLFVFVKLVGTATVCATLMMLFQYRQRMAMLTTYGVATFQAALLCYLTLA